MARKSSGNGENEHHVVAVRLRVKGSGSLQLSLQDLDNVRTVTIFPITMQALTRIEPLRQTNFQSQRIRLTGTTTAIDENFSINRIVIFAKPVAMDYPG